MAMACDEREEFTGLLDGLTPEQWEHPTLCERWRVRDVVAHAFGFDEFSRTQVIGLFLRGRLSFDRINGLGVAEYAGRTPEELCAMVHAHRQPRGLTAAFGGMIALVDGMIHQQDIRRPLGRPRDIPAARLHTVLDFARYVPVVRGAWRARGVRLVADDLDWTAGKGPEVHGSGEALLMAMAARRAALDDLTGPGKSTLAEHI
ncbi:MAG: maleylpyruvate isomerase family mycothiol-dependent enzyme [Mycobacterium sp.]